MKHIKLFENADGEPKYKVKTSMETLTPEVLRDTLSSLMMNNEFLNWAGKIAVDDASYRPGEDELIDGYCELVCGYILLKWPGYKAKGCGLPGLVIDQLIFRQSPSRPHSCLRWNLGPGDSDPGARVRARIVDFAFPNSLYFDAATPEGVDHWLSLRSIPNSLTQEPYWSNRIFYKSCVKLPKQVTRVAGLNPPIPITLKRLGLL